MVKVVRIWKGDLMMRSKSLAKNKDLQRKVLCSLLAAGVMSVCISGGDVWAQPTTTVQYGGEKVEGGYRVIYVPLTKTDTLTVTDNGAYGVTTVQDRTITIDYGGNPGTANPAVQARADQNMAAYPVLNIFTQGDLTVSGKQTAVSGQDGAVNLSSSTGDITLSTNFTSSANLPVNKTTAQHLSNEAYSTIYARNLYSKDKVAGAVTVSGKNVNILTAEQTMTGIGMENVKYGTAISGNGNGSVDIHATDVVVIRGAIESLNTFMQNKGTTGIKINVNQAAADTAKVTMEGLFINAADKSEVNIKGAAGSSITADLLASATTSVLGSGGKINVDFTDGGSIKGAVNAQNGGLVSVKGAEINGAIKVDGIDSEYHGTDTALTTVTADLSTYTGSEKGAVIVTNNGNAVFDGKQTLITVDADHAGKVFGVILDKGKAEFNADTTVINVNNTNAIGTWDYAVDVKADSQAVFNGKDVSIKAVKTDYTSQTFTVRDRSTADFNNSGTTIIEANSNASVTALDVKNGGIMNVNSDILAIKSEILGGKEAAINAIGIQIHSEDGHSQSTQLNITDKVNDFSIDVKGQGYDYDGTSYSSGTAALNASDQATATIESKKFTANVVFNDETASSDNNHNVMAGLWAADAGKIVASKATDTVVNVTKTGPSAAKAYAVWSTGKNSDISLLGNTTITATGKTASNALLAEDGGQITVGSELLKGTGSNNTVTVGSTSDSAGTLTLGNAAAESSGGTLNANVTLQSDSQMNVEAGRFTVDKITATEGTVAVNAGANLTTTQDFTVGDAINNKTGTIDAAGSITAGKVDLQQGTVAVTGSLTANELSVGTSNKEGTVTAAGTVDVGTLNLNKGNVEVTGSLTAKTLTVGDSAAKIAVGAADSAGTLTAEDVKLGGASLMLDPAWEDGSTIQTASKAGLKFNGSQIDGKLTVGQNSVLSLGTADTAKAEAAFTDTGLTWGQNDITAALYIDYEQTMDSTKGGIKVDGSLTHVSDSKDLAAANTATFAAGSLLMVAGDAALTMDGALKAGGTATITISNGSAATLKVDSGAKLYIADAQADKQYTIVSGFTNSGSDVTDGGWNGTNLLLNKLVKGSGSYSSGSFTVSTQKVKASEALPGVALPNILDAMSSQTDSPYAGIKYLSNAISGLNSNAQTLAAVNSFAQGAENSGATRTGALAALDLGTAAQEHLSLAKAAAEQSGGFGKAAVDTADNGSIWAQYIHNKDKVDNMGGVSYDGQYNGVIIGGDFADRGKYSSGIAFSYGSGDSTGSASKNEFDFWGLSYYGGIQNGDTNLIFDVGYSKTSSDVKGVIKAEPDTQVISMGVKGEKLISNGHGTSYVPYAGLRYMNIDTDSYNGSIDGKTAAHYSTDKADLWLLPVGISISHESVTAGGWKVRPTADIAYVWTLGDKNTAMDITVPGVNATDRLGYDIMDSGFFVGKLGLEAEKGDWTYGLGYACQKGSHAQNSKFMLNVTYSF